MLGGWLVAFAILGLVATPAQGQIFVQPSFTLEAHAAEEARPGEAIVLTVNVARHNPSPTGGQQEVRIEFSSGPFTVVGPETIHFTEDAPPFGDLQQQEAVYSLTFLQHARGLVTFNVSVVPGANSNPFFGPGQQRTVPVTVDVASPPSPLVASIPVLKPEDDRGTIAVGVVASAATLAFVILRRRRQHRLDD